MKTSNDHIKDPTKSTTEKGLDKTVRVITFLESAALLGIRVLKHSLFEEEEAAKKEDLCVRERERKQENTNLVL